MKEIVVTGKRVKWELYTFLICFVLANLANIYAISSYNTDWKEAYTMLPFVVLLSIGFYVAFAGLRLLIFGIKSSIKS